MSIKNSTRRILLRKNLETFKVAFYADAAQTIPMIPIDASKYPAYSIYDINNQLIQSGIGSPEMTPGSYKTQWLIAPDAPLSNDIQRWRIEWTMVSVDNRQVDFVEEFDVKDVVITASETREQKFVTLMNNDYRVSLRLSHVPQEVGLTVYPFGNTQNPTVNVTDTTGILKSMDGDSVVYYYDLPASIMGENCSHSIIWRVREQLTDPYQFVHQNLTSISPTVLNLVTSLRMLIDKFQKRLGTITAYEDSDLIEYLARGHELINATYPSSFYGFGFLPSSLTVFHVMASAVYGLSAQQLLNVELGVNFSGQSVTFDYDHASGLSDVISKWQDYINTNLPPAKMAIKRATSPVGTVAGRAYRYNSLNNYTYRVGSVRGGSGNLIGTMTHLGLLF